MLLVLYRINLINMAGLNCMIESNVVHVSLMVSGFPDELCGLCLPMMVGCCLCL